MRVCIPIIAETEDEALQKMNGPLSGDPFLEILFELRVDRMREIRLERILREKKKKIVVTNRRREEGGNFQGAEKERIVCLLKAVHLGADFVDLEASTEAGLLAELKSAIAERDFRTRLIVSAHDFAGTPGEGALRNKLKECAALSPDIVKIVTRARGEEDNLKVLGLIPHARKSGQEIISFCLGEKGRMSRVMCLLLGAHMSFASLNKGEESAPGQLTLAEMAMVLSTLNETRRGRLDSLREVGLIRGKNAPGPDTVA